MAIDTNPQAFTDADLLALARKAIADILVGGQAYGVGGRTLTRADLRMLWETVAVLEARAQGDVGAGGVALGVFGDPV